MARVRQFGSVRNSRSSSASKIPNQTPTKLEKHKSGKDIALCVDCTNFSLSKQKSAQKETQKIADLILKNQIQLQEKREEEKSRLLKLKKVQYERREMMEPNFSLSRLRINKKQQQAMRKLEDRRKQEELLKEQQKQKATELHRQKLLKQKWLTNIKGQIMVKQRQRQFQRQMKSQEKPDQAIFYSPPINRSHQQKIIHNLLKQQISDEKSRKMKEKRQAMKSIDIQSNPIVEQAQQRQKVFKRTEEQRKKLLLQDARNKQQQLLEAKSQKALKNIRERQAYKKKMEDETKQIQKQIQMKQKQMDKYMNAISKQIQANNIQRLEQKQNKLKQRQNPIFPLNKRILPKQNCDSCKKSVEKTYITRFKSPI